jgi:UDP-N-acetylmuramate dehydrogenase
MTIHCIKNQSLDKFTTFKIGGKTECIYIPETKADLAKLACHMDLSNNFPFVIGAGSNVLISNKGIKKPVISLKKMQSIDLLDNTTIKVEAGSKLPALAFFCLEKRLSGLEFIAGIPGTLGGAIFMNASVKEKSISDNLISVEILDLQTNSIKEYKKDELDFDYRHSSIIPGRQIILSACFELEQEEYICIKAKIQKYINARKNTQPAGFNAGSIFKNPDHIKTPSSGYLIDKIGAKGWKEGGAEISNIHANFINNINNASSLDVSRLMYRMYNAVKEKTGYILHPEVLFVGEPTKEEEKIWKILLQK